jgi:hydrogenase 3 maturation protease
MQSLGQQLQRLHGRIGLLCVGNSDGGDDALGVRLGEELAGAGIPDVVIAGTEPEKWVFGGAAEGFDHLIFVDAVDFGGEPGSVVFLNREQMTGRFPQVSTHRLSLGLPAQLTEERGTTKAWLLGVQPQSLQPGPVLSPSVQATLAVLNDLLRRRLSAGVSIC